MPENPSQNKRDVVMEFGSAAMKTSGTSWFFGIGINNYTHFTPLYNAVKDVQDLVQLLQEQYDIDTEHTLTLYNEEATRKNVIKMLDHLQREVGSADKLIIYYSGHGHLNKETNKGYWIPTDAERDNTSEYIRNSTIREYIETLKPLHTLLISDSCFSGSLFVRGASRSTATVNELATIPSRWAICSGRHDEEVFDGEPGKNSPFAESIMDTLRRNQKKEINVARLVDRVIDQTRSNYKQLPEGNPLYGVGHKGGQYIFNRRADEGEDWVTAKAAGSLAGYRQFQENHPNGKHADEARKKIAALEEDAAWEKAKTKHTILAYYEYDQAYPNGRYSRLALDAMTELEEETAWQEAERRNMLSGYRQYTTDYPRGKYRAEADARISAIISSKQEPVLWKQTTLRDTAEAYTAYLKRYPEGIYAGEARNRLSELEQAGAEKEQADEKQRAAEQKQGQEATAWTSAQKTATEAAYRKFLLAYPKGRFTAEAKAALKDLQQTKASPAASPPRQEVKQPARATASRSSASRQEKQVRTKSSLPKWLPMAAGGLVLVLVVGWGISQLSGSSSEVPVIDLEVFEDEGKYGYRDGAGQEKIAARFDNAGSFNNGKARVTLNGQTFTIDESGNCVADCPEDKDKAAWAEAKRANTKNAYTTYLKNFPNGLFTDEARNRIDTQNEQIVERNRDNEKVTQPKKSSSTPTENTSPPPKKAVTFPKKSTATTKGGTYATIQFKENGLTWMAENLNIDDSDWWCYDKDPANCTKYGRLYTWAAAKKACASLGSGWRLPTDEEWKSLAQSFGGYHDFETSKDIGDPKKAYTSLLDGGSSGLSAQLGGNRDSDGSFDNLGSYGYYWSATENGSDFAWYYDFNRNYGELYRIYDTRAFGRSCRCVQD